MTHGRRIGGTAVLFALALVCVAIASTTHSVIPVFVAWIPLLLVPWWLTRPVAGDVQPTAAADAHSPAETEQAGSTPDPDASAGGGEP
jgi:hypothetical protein